MAHNPIFHGRTKHIEVRHHFIHEKIESREIKLEFVSIVDQVADILTKALGRIVFERLREKIGLVKLDPSVTTHNTQDNPLHLEDTH